MSGTTVQGTPVQQQTDTLKVSDRCIRCNGQAFVKVETLDLGDFLFCLHDWKKNQDALEPLAVHVTDESYKLLPKPYDPATDNS